MALTARETEVNCDSESVRNSSSKNYTLKHLLDMISDNNNVLYELKIPVQSQKQS